MNPLQLQKQFLIEESELNRIHMIGDVAEVVVDIFSLTDRARSFGSITSSAAVVVSSLAAILRGKSKRARTKQSWLPIMLEGAGLVSALWLAFHSQGRDQQNE